MGCLFVGLENNEWESFGFDERFSGLACMKSVR